eukprot:TRINITY_DN3945_c0_g1_i6.p2 TRINITY_DN3945_c0_g1~~TRINITY_DN3945_c0_g1_i6.p2  ORF type:complete len:255 (+),score=38.69 TRINITY_DN3945_c0_g1_i6:135-899(+)
MTVSRVPLIDHFIIFGIDKRDVCTRAYKALKPAIIGKYPNSFYHSHDLEMICFPQGYHIKEINATNILMQVQVNHYTLANTRGEHRFLSALTFSEIVNEYKESHELDSVALAVPKAFCLVSSHPVFETHKYFLIFMFRQLLLNFYKNKGSDFATEFLFSFIFHTLPLNIDEKNDLLLIHNSEPDDILMRYNVDMKQILHIPNYSFELLIKKICIEDILTLACALMLEKKVVLIFKNYQQNAVIMQSLISLMQPL